MQDLFRRLRLITPITLEFPLSPDQFVQRLQPHVAPPYTNPFGRLGRIFSPAVAPYTGIVKATAIRIKARGDGSQIFLPLITATLTPVKAGVRLDGELNGVNFTLLAAAAFHSLFLIIGLFSLAFKNNPGRLSDFPILLLMLLLPGVVFVGIPYVKARRSMQQTAYDLERDLFYFVERPAQPTMQ